MPLISRCVAVAVLMLSVVSGATAENRFVSDVINLSIRERPANDAGVIGQVSSGESVEVLEALGPESFTRIRDANGREGWVTSRYLTTEPAARVQLAKAEAELAESNRALTDLQRDFDAAQSRLADAASALELADENEQLKSVIAELQDNEARLIAEGEADRERRALMLTGAGLVGGGVVLGLLLPALGRRKRRYGEL
ncbi:TIGR04211 family SH3 domain-containing protein [Polycyclovorans algicola]|uniref:TIGR04211 family SH3 domain-containing protein n=1 Tax=Polycyclovorans algicola TaxID=616992 RepID=UPI0004A749F1|nr:TIGR04211 family SH3 domain-containing protein [Polycyclovorans algicola]